MALRLHAVSGVLGCVLLLALAPGCGDDDGPASPTDAGGGRTDSGMTRTDAGGGGGTDAGGRTDGGGGGTDGGGGGDVDAGGGGDVDAGGTSDVDAGGTSDVDAGGSGGTDAGGGGGTDAGTTASDAGPAPPSCAEYCPVVMANCTGTNAQYTSADMCLMQCAFFAWSAGVRGATAGDTIACRLYHAGVPSMDDPVLHCPHAGPTGGTVCTDG